jgi:hypothetical protein
VNAFVEKVCKVLDELTTKFPGSQPVSSLRHRILHVHSNSIESMITRPLEANLPGSNVNLEDEEMIGTNDEKIDARHLDTSMSHRIERWLQRNPSDPVIPEFRLHRRCRAKGTDIDEVRPMGSASYMAQFPPLSWDQALVTVQKAVLGESWLVCATFHNTEGLRAKGFEADVAILDELSQVTDAIAAIPLTDQISLKLVAGTGDSAQLGPAVTSSRGKNPARELLLYQCLVKW